MSKSETNRQHLSNQPRLLTAVLEHQLPITIFHIFDKSDSLITKLITNVLTNHFFFSNFAWSIIDVKKSTATVNHQRFIKNIKDRNPL